MVTKNSSRSSALVTLIVDIVRRKICLNWEYGPPNM